jgi:hypothetical protein
MKKIEGKRKSVGEITYEYYEVQVGGKNYEILATPPMARLIEAMRPLMRFDAMDFSFAAVHAANLANLDAELDYNVEDIAKIVRKIQQGMAYMAIFWTSMLGASRLVYKHGPNGVVLGAKTSDNPSPKVTGMTDSLHIETRHSAYIKEDHIWAKIPTDLNLVRN